MFAWHHSILRSHCSVRMAPFSLELPSSGVRMAPFFGRLLSRRKFRAKCVQRSLILRRIEYRERYSIKSTAKLITCQELSKARSDVARIVPKDSTAPSTKNEIAMPANCRYPEHVRRPPL